MRKLVTYLVLVLNLIFCIVGIYYLNKDGYGSIETDSDIVSISEDMNSNFNVANSITSVQIGNVSEVFTAKAKVSSSEDEIYTFTTLLANKGQTGWQKSIGDKVSKGEVIFVNNKYSFKSPIRGKIIDIVQNEGYSTITFIDYSKLYLKASINSKNAQDVKYKSSATFEVNENNMNAKVFYTSGIVSEEDDMEAFLNYKDENMLLMPGMQVNLSFTAKEKNDVLYLPLEYVYVKNNDYYVYRENQDAEGSYDKINVDIGLVGSEVVEIKSGLNENDIIYQIYIDEKNLLSNKIGELTNEQ